MNKKCAIFSSLRFNIEIILYVYKQRDKHGAKFISLHACENVFIFINFLNIKSLHICFQNFCPPTNIKYPT